MSVYVSQLHKQAYANDTLNRQNLYRFNTRENTLKMPSDKRIKNMALTVLFFSPVVACFN